jgi:uncharacterized membrane protein YbhN (UPF0104 family)
LNRIGGGRIARWSMLLANVLVLVLFVAAVEHYGGFQKLFAPWRSLHLTTLALALLGMFASYGLRALRIYWAEQAIPRGHYRGCLRLILINNALNWIVPWRAGEASFPILMKRWFGIDPARATGTLLWLRLLDLHVLGSVAAACVAVGWLGTTVTVLARLGWLLAAGAPLALFLLRAPLARYCAGRKGRIAALAGRAAGGLPQRVWGLALDLVLTWAGWTVKLAALSAVLTELTGLPTTLGLLGAIGGDLSTVLPIHAPGGFGTYEAGVVALTGISGFTTAKLLAGAVNLHLLVLTTALLSGLGAWILGPVKPPAIPAANAKL